MSASAPSAHPATADARPRSRPEAARALVGALMLAVLSAACGAGAGTDATPTPAPTATPGPTDATPWPTDATPGPTGAATDPATEAPTATPSATESATATATETAPPMDGEATPSGVTELTVFLARDDGTMLWVEPTTFALEEPTTGVARAAIGLVLAGPDPDDPGLTRLTDPASEVLGASIADGVLTVDLNAAVQDTALGGEAEATLQQLLAHTGTQFDGIDAVRVRIEGEDIDTLWGHSDWSEPLVPDELVLSPIIITSATVDGLELIVAGTANTFEANLGLRLLDGDGAELEETFTTATCGTGCRGDWEHTFTLPGPGTYTVEAVEDDPSGGEGRPPFTATVTVEA